MADNTNSANQTQKKQFYKKKHREQMKHQVITFAMMIAFTMLAFGLVMAEVDAMFTVPIILVLAAVQVLFQLYYFMHMAEEGHEWPAAMIYSGVFAAVLTILALTIIVWW
ncbi:cytochrome c oxidase subunit IVB [Alkalibacillus haloalkaliphilus]|uniref:Cytochrome c oxidase subunit 4B n=1 Tax=Alkalibacillus haloalkaliphilus TaxID=94136 RepID=A0A511W143_9BACI|nr:cytochrome c oxidase subunit IVB [Alkalibacillus haloalkaliphilus]GEN44774.1 cytochrome c oxidase subunit 4B [Alkalibacillus haloalkaliphilus]